MANGLNLIKAIIEALGYILKWIWQVFVSFLPYWGIEDIIKNVGVFYIVLIVLSMLGIYLSIKRRKKLWAVICFLGDIFGFIGVFLLKYKSK